MSAPAVPCLVCGEPVANELVGLRESGVVNAHFKCNMLLTMVVGDWRSGGRDDDTAMLRGLAQQLMWIAGAIERGDYAAA